MNEDRASRYHRLRRRAALASTVAAGAALVWLLAGGRSSHLAAWAAGLAAPLPWPIRPLLAIVLVAGLLALGWEALSFPSILYRNFLLDRKYGLSSEPLKTWLGDHLKALALGLTITVASAAGVYATMKVSPGWWWLIAAGLFVILTIAISRMAPVWLMPMFYRFQPLRREELRRRLLALSARAGVSVLGAFEWGLGEKTSRANAALVGLGRTRRIIISDTLLKDYSDEEIEVVLAHELAHHVHHDLWTALALEAAVVAVALCAAHVAGTRAAPALGLRGPSDLAALPLLVLAAGAVSVVLTPMTNAWSRRNERRADRFALTLTGRPDPFISAMRRLGAQNLAEERPSAPVFWFFHTHPTIEERVAAAKAFTAR